MGVAVFHPAAGEGRRQSSFGGGVGWVPSEGAFRFRSLTAALGNSMGTLPQVAQSLQAKFLSFPIESGLVDAEDGGGLHQTLTLGKYPSQMCFFQFFKGAFPAGL